MNQNDLLILEVEAISKSFGKTRVLDSLDLQVPKGHIVEIRGANGSGKTTLLSILSSLTKPDSGAVMLNGLNVEKFGAIYRRCIGSVFHAPLIYEQLTPKENLEHFGRLYRLPNVTEVVEEKISRLHLDHWGDQKVGTLSNGLRKRVSIAKSMLHGPQLLLLDEPDTGLDEETIRILGDVFDEFSGNGGAVLLTTHTSSIKYRAPGCRYFLVAGKLSPERGPNHA